MQIYISRDGECYGPYNIKNINAYLVNGILLPADLAWQDGMTDWFPVSQISGVVMPEGSVAAPIPPSQPVSIGSSKKILIGIAAGLVFLAIMVGIWFFLIPGRENMGTGVAIGQLIGKSMGVIALIAIIWSFGAAVFGASKGGSSSSDGNCSGCSSCSSCGGGGCGGG